MLKTILSIAGKPGLYKLISSGKNMLIVETVDAAKKRIPAYGQDKVISQKFFPTMTVTVCTQVTSRSCCHGTISW